VARSVDSAALEPVNKQLGLKGGTAPTTLLEDGDLRQTFDTNAAVRRGRADVGTGGWFYGILEMVHAGSGTITATIDPYAPAGSQAGSYPRIVPPDFDLWIESYAIIQDSGSAAMSYGALRLVPDAGRTQGWGEDNLGAAVVSSTIFGLGLFDSLDAQGFGLTEAGEQLVKLGLRLPRGCTLSARTIADGVTTLHAIVTLGLFPIGMGSDVADW